MRIEIVDVGPRDGLQNENKSLPPEVRIELCKKMAAAGISRVEAASFVNPKRVPQMAGAEEVLSGIERRPSTTYAGLALFHDTRNTGIANALAAIEAGATVLDASVGGTGGCPFAPRATGNIATEDLVYMLHGMGHETGVNLGKLIETAAWLSEQLGKELPGQVYKAGTFEPVAG